METTRTKENVQKLEQQVRDQTKIFREVAKSLNNQNRLLEKAVGELQKMNREIDRLKPYLRPTNQDPA